MGFNLYFSIVLYLLICALILLSYNLIAKKPSFIIKNCLERVTKNMQVHITLEAIHKVK